MINLRFRPITLVVLAILFAVPAVAEEVWYAGVASLPGLNGTRWRTEVVLFNGTDASKAVRLELRDRGADAAGPARSLNLAAGEVLRIADLYADLGAPAGAGSLRIEGTVMSWVRTFNQGKTGRFGQDVPPMRSAKAVLAGETRLFSATAAENLATGDRSNLLLFNFGPGAATFTVKGCGTATSLEIPVGAYDQLNNLGKWLDCPDGPFVAEVKATAPWAGYVSAVDPATGDPTTVSGLLAPSGSEPENRPPVVAYFAIVPATLLVGDEADVVGVFYDPDEERVSWSVRIDPRSAASGGMAGPTTGTDALVSRVKARTSGSLAVEVTVTDGHGGVTTALARATVRCCGP